MSGTHRAAPPARSGIPNINQLDHQIHLHNGSTSILELSLQRLQLAKQRPPLNLSARIEELTRELGHQRQEINFYRQGFENLQRLREAVYDISQKLFLAYYINHDINSLDDLIIQLRDALEDSTQEEARAKKAWMDFWGINCNTGENEGGWV